MAVAGFVVVMGLLHSQDPRSFGVKGPREGKQYFYPSEAITANGKFIPARTLMMDDYCLKCHQGRLRGLVPLGPPLQLVQQPGVPDQRPRDAPGLAGARRHRPRPPAGAPAATTRCRSSRASSTTPSTTT